MGHALKRKGEETAVKLTEEARVLDVLSDRLKGNVTSDIVSELCKETYTLDRLNGALLNIVGTVPHKNK